VMSITRSEVKGEFANARGKPSCLPYLYRAQ
jgi:hypothetical protein